SGTQFQAAVPASAVRDRRVALAYSRQLCARRSVLVHSLIHAYKTFGPINRAIGFETPARVCTARFHSEAYLSALKRVSSADLEADELDSDLLEFGFAYDCPPVRGAFDIASLVAGATVAAAEALSAGQFDVAINWTGGWHHAKRDEASGFCYINDIVYGVLELKKRYDRVMYIDLDLHHGDGVEEAFYYSAGILTVSFHYRADGFFPGSGDSDDIGAGPGRFASVNVPLKEGVSDAQFAASFAAVIDAAAFEAFDPGAVVCQCGADALATDEFKIFNLTLTGYLDCVKLLLQSRRPLLLLGGGGYHFPSTAKLWTAITALAVGVDLDKDIPEHSFFSQYGPDFCLDVTPSLKRNLNDSTELRLLVESAVENLKRLAEALQLR
uniref:Histone deacetylase n=1 Tax=Macrostomum lignano TaxID=282301 RepID=A0A1I8FJU5_9PLAT